MKLPKFLLGDTINYPEAVFVVHTDYPRFIINVVTDEVEWFEEIDRNDEAELRMEMENLIKAAIDFYDNELKNYEA